MFAVLSFIWWTLTSFQIVLVIVNFALYIGFGYICSWNLLSFVDLVVKISTGTSPFFQYHVGFRHRNVRSQLQTWAAGPLKYWHLPCLHRVHDFSDISPTKSGRYNGFQSEPGTPRWPALVPPLAPGVRDPALCQQLIITLITEVY